MTDFLETLRPGRRRFLAGLAATTAAPWLGVGCGSTASAPETTWLSAQGSQETELGLVAVSTPFTSPEKIATGFRGHDVAQNPTRPWEFVLFGRRPGTESAVVDLSRGAMHTTFPSVPGFAFQGHGFFTPDGRTLVTVEADMRTAAGLLAVRDADSHEVQRVVETRGVGPHEAQLMPDEATVVVGNGGLLTRPETGREVLNLETMDSTLVYLDLETGTLLDERRVPNPKASIRHLDVTQRGEVAFGAQVQREALDHEDLVLLCGVHRIGGEVELFDSAPEHTAVLNDYVGSVAVSDSSRVAGFTSPRGDVAAFWSLDSGDAVGLHELVDCSGLATSPDGESFWLSSSLGEVRTLSARDASEDETARRRFENVKWDNHLIAAVF